MKNNNMLQNYITSLQNDIDNKININKECDFTLTLPT